MTHTTTRLTTLILALTLCVSGRAQVFSGTSHIITSLDERITTLDSLIFHTQHTPVTTPPFNDWDTDCPPDTAYTNRLATVTESQIQALRAETGLQITGQTYYRPDSQLGLTDDEDAVSRYWGKVQVEARWYFLQSALFNTRSRINLLRLQADLQRLQHERTRISPTLYTNREQLRITSDSLLATIMLHRVDNLKLLEDAYLYLLEGENISSDNLLRILDDRAEAERRLSTVTTAPTRATSLQAVTVWLVNIDTTALLNTYIEGDINYAILDTRTAILNQQIDNTSWWSDVRIAPFVRYSHYFRQEVPGSSNVDVGVSFTVPINTQAARQRQTLRHEQALIQAERDDLTAAATDRIRYLVREAERLNRAIEGECQRATSLRRYLQVRHQAYTQRQGEYNRISAMMEYNVYLRCLENILQLQHQRDTHLSDLQALTPTIPLNTYTTFESLSF